VCVRAILCSVCVRVKRANRPETSSNHSPRLTRTRTHTHAHASLTPRYALPPAFPSRATRRGIFFFLFSVPSAAAGSYTTVVVARRRRQDAYTHTLLPVRPTTGRPPYHRPPVAAVRSVASRMSFNRIALLVYIGRAPTTTTTPTLSLALSSPEVNIYTLHIITCCLLLVVEISKRSLRIANLTGSTTAGTASVT